MSKYNEYGINISNKNIKGVHAPISGVTDFLVVDSIIEPKANSYELVLT